MSHRFKIGQPVRFLRTSLVRDNGVYEVIRLMPPAEDQAPQYRVKSGIGQERAVREHELTPHDPDTVARDGAVSVGQPL